MNKRFALLENRKVISLHNITYSEDPLLFYRPLPPIYKIELDDTDYPNIGDERDPYTIIRLSKIDFWRLFTGQQLKRIQAWRNALLSLNPTNMNAPENDMFDGLAQLLNYIDSTDIIELNNPDTITGIMALGTIGIYGTDPVIAGAEINRILSGTSP